MPAGLVRRDRAICFTDLEAASTLTAAPAC
jgi:hypothetical protein